MSIWTHVVGAIRIDGIPSIDPDALDRLIKVLGPMETFEDLSEDKNIECKLPMGSEGSIEYNIHVYGDGLRWAIISIWGDLRDYDKPELIKVWFTGLLNDLNNNDLPVRDAIIRIEVEGSDPIVVSSN